MKPSIFFLLATSFTTSLSATSWPEFRGPNGDGVATAENVPVTFGETESLKWKTELPGRGWSSPVFDGKTLWVTTAEEIFPDEEEKTRILKEAGEEEKVFASRQVATRIELSALAVDYETGKVLKTVELANIDNPQTIHTLNSFASPTPVLADGVLYAHFGAFGTFAIDTEAGSIRWQTKIDLEHGVGPGSSPVLHRGRLILICDGVDRQFVTALDATSGKALWTTDRPEMRAATGDQKKSYNTPVVVTGKDGREQLICMGAQWLVSYAPETGEEIWRLDHGDGFSVVPRPVYSPKTGLLYLSTGYGKPELLAVRIDGKGDITGSDKIAWREAKRIPARPSPVLVGDELYVIADGGVASCFDAGTGTLHWTERVDGNYCASPLFADGHLYFSSQEGAVTVVKPGRTFEVVARNTLEGTLMASPMALDGNLIVRSGTALYRFSK
ncbi:MAG: PQQ-binding-like beta-propeller repeat protein [Verrucomicrobiales bacterium]|nr:PQQ-binding-like beta-propeller repeat protein [Verrucomicrobiales bacterium]